MNIDQVYQDFTTQLLPKIQEGLVITKDYFVDLFGRYIQYLIITDIIKAVIYLTCFIVGIITSLKVWKIYLQRKEKKVNDPEEVLLAWTLTFTIILVSLIGMFHSTTLIIKDFYIPEVRIIEEIQNFKAQS